MCKTTHTVLWLKNDPFYVVLYVRYSEVRRFCQDGSYFEIWCLRHLNAGAFTGQERDGRSCRPVTWWNRDVSLLGQVNYSYIIPKTNWKPDNNSFKSRPDHSHWSEKLGLWTMDTRVLMSVWLSALGVLLSGKCLNNSCVIHLSYL